MFRASPWRQSNAVIRDTDLYLVRAALGYHRHGAAGSAPGDAVTNGIFNERQAKQIAQVLDHSARQPRIALDLRRDGVERIEEEMRIKLHTQRIQARLRKVAPHSLQPHFTSKVVFVVSESLLRASALHAPRPSKARIAMNT